MDQLSSEHPYLQEAVLYALEETARTWYEPPEKPRAIQPTGSDLAKIEEEENEVPTMRPGVVLENEETDGGENEAQDDDYKRTKALRFFAHKLLEHRRIHGYGVMKYNKERDRDAYTEKPKNKNRRRSSVDATLTGLPDEGEEEEEGGVTARSSETGEGKDDQEEENNRIRAQRGNRRANVFAEPVKLDPDFKPQVIEKSEQEKQEIRDIFEANILFASCDEDQKEILVDAMELKHFQSGETIIQQGEMGDFFYILASGTCDIYKDGNLVLQVSEGMGFGELALLYDSPRAATVVATSDCTAWSIDRVTFKQVMMGTTLKKRDKYLSFLREVPILSTLTDDELRSLADSVNPQKFEEGENVVEEGATDADRFYIVEKGELKGTKKNVAHEVCPRLKVGSYFGERALLTKEPRAATITAVKPSTCLAIDRAAFVRLLGPVKRVLSRNMEVYEKYVKHDKK